MKSTPIILHQQTKKSVCLVQGVRTMIRRDVCEGSFEGVLAHRYSDFVVHDDTKEQR